MKKALKVRVRMPLLGCSSQPYFATRTDALFAASSESEQQLRALEYVISVEPMPVLKIGW